MANLIELVSQSVSLQTSKSPMTTDQSISEINKVHSKLKQLVLVNLMMT